MPTNVAEGTIVYQHACRLAVRASYRSAWGRRIVPAARLRYIAGTAWSAKCYMNMRPLYQPQVTQTEAVA